MASTMEERGIKINTAAKTQNSGRRDGYILGVDLLVISPIDRVDLLCRADFLRQGTQEEIVRRLAGRKVNLLLSDMAPNPTGESRIDHLRIMELCQSLLEFGTNSNLNEPILAREGVFLCKIFDGPQRRDFMMHLKSQFRSVQFIKPDASRDSSSEIYLFASGFRAVNNKNF